jgi:hypothetical protein
LQQIAHALGQIRQLDRGAGIVSRRMQFTSPRLSTMRFIPFASAVFTSSRSNDVSSPNTIRPLHSIARIPSTVRFVSFNCMKFLLGGPPQRPRRSRTHTELVAPA